MPAGDGLSACGRRLASYRLIRPGAAELVERHGKGVVELTNRASPQIRGVPQAPTAR